MNEISGYFFIKDCKLQVDKSNYFFWNTVKYVNSDKKCNA